MVVASPKVASVYQPRRPRQLPLYQIIERYFPEFERTYDAPYGRRYGPWRPIVGEVVRKFLAELTQHLPEKGEHHTPLLRLVLPPPAGVRA